MNIMKSTSTRKLTWLAYFGLTGLSLLVIASPSSPSFAADQSSQPQFTQASNDQPAVAVTCPAGGQCFADVPPSNPFFAFINTIYMQNLVGGYACGGPGEPCDQYHRPYYRPGNIVNRSQMAKFIYNARTLPGIYLQSATEVNAGLSAQSLNGPALLGTSSNNGMGVDGSSTNGIGIRGTSTNYEGVEGDTGSNYAAVYGHNTNTTYQAPGVRGDAVTGPGVYGLTDNHNSAGVEGENGQQGGIGVEGNDANGVGVEGHSSIAYGVAGFSNSTAGVFGQGASGPGVMGASSTNDGVAGLSDSGNGLYGQSVSGPGVYGQSSTGLAGYFDGNVTVTGTCCAAGAGTYKIDDPLDPTGKYLNQSAVASSEMLDIYTGHATLDANGEAWVDMPQWFQALNEDFDYQLTCVGGYAQVYVAREIENNRFEIAGGKSGLKVSWQVTSKRHDAYAMAHSIAVEQAKPPEEQGKYLHPTEAGQPASLGVDYTEQQRAQNYVNARP